MIKSDIKIGNFPTYINTPYQVPIGNRVEKIEVNESNLKVIENDGKYYREVPISKQVIFDGKKYKKIYDEGIDIMRDLSEPSYRMYLYILKNLPINSIELYISLEDYRTYNGYNQNNKFVYYKAVTGLLKKDIIARKVGSTNVFFVNPNFIYNGDRTKFPNHYNSLKPGLGAQGHRIPENE